MGEFSIADHRLVPEHRKMTKEEVADLLEQYDTAADKLPKIAAGDVGISHIAVEVGDVIEIKRDSPTAGKTVYYRVVV